MDGIIDVIAAAQQEDGYLYTAHITGVSKGHASSMGDKPYSYVVHSHELYNVGHMYEGAIAYYQATGKRKWLDVAEKSAQHLNRVFFEGDPNYNGGKPVMQAPGHQEVELALVKLYRITNNTLYLEMSRKFLEVRGVTFKPEGKGVMSPIYAQQHLPVKEQTNAVGHAVRAVYQYTGMADVDAASGTHDFTKALDAIWHNIVDTKMAITGGLGAIHGIEGFGPEYELPNKSAYNETCAAVGNVFYNYRMFLAEKKGKFLDVAEVALYNNALAGVNLEGNKFFYVNPLEADGITPFNHGKTGRSPWFGTACCPSNIARLIPQVSGMMYAKESDKIYCALYASNSTTIELKSGNVKLKQETKYPFDGKISLSVFPEFDGQEFSLLFRIPTWAISQFVPGELYHYLNELTSDWTIKKNGQLLNVEIEKGFVTVSGRWDKGDNVLLNLPMPVHFNRAHFKVKADIDRLAVTRGPLVYCAEGFDNESEVQQYYFHKTNTKKSKISALSMGPLDSIPYVSLPAKLLSQSKGNKRGNLKMLPYFLWNNRDDGSMVVWVPTNKKLITDKLDIPDVEGKFKKVVASHTYGNDDLGAISDGQVPENSADTSIPRWTSWPQKGEKQWIEIELKQKTNIKSVGVYWYDDNGGVQVPQSWMLKYWKNGKWTDFPIYVTDLYNTFKNQYIIIHPGEELKIEKLRIEMTPKSSCGVGIMDILIEEI